MAILPIMNDACDAKKHVPQRLTESVKGAG